MGSLHTGLSHEQEDEVSTLMMKISEANDETQRNKRAHTQSEKDRASAELALRSLQQKFDQLTRYGFSLQSILGYGHVPVTLEGLLSQI